MSTKPCLNCGKEVYQRYTSKYKPNHWLCIECKEKEKELSHIVMLQLEKEYFNGDYDISQVQQ